MPSYEIFHFRSAGFSSRLKLPARPSFALLLVLALLLVGCAEADDLGDAPPDSTVIRSTEINWVGGIGFIFTTKCGTCHNFAPDPSVPLNIPEDLDLTKIEGDGITFRGARDIFPFIRAGILERDLDSPQTRKMPLPFATPLTSHEIRNMILWTEAGGPSGVAANTCVIPADDTERSALETRGQQLFNTPQSSGASACQLCHSVSHYSRLDCSVLEPKVITMFDSIAGNGAGAWDLLSIDDQDALLFYVAE